VYALALIEGQAGFDFLVISLVLIVIILYCVKFKGFKLKNNVFTYFILIYLISTVISMIVYGVITGFKPGYPFFYQLSE
jgi:ABC-type sugar transport system permease subunit